MENLRAEDLKMGSSKCKLCYDWLNSRQSFINAWGIPDAWQVTQAYEVCLFYQKLTRNPELDVTKFLRDKFLSAVTIQNVKYWFGLSGSDDLEWAAVLNLHCYLEFTDQAFLDQKPGWVLMARGAFEFLNEIQSHYVTDEGYVFWNYEKTYVASISNSLYIRLCLMLNKVHPDEKLVNQAKKTCNWLMNVSGLWDTDGGIMDGIRSDGSFDRTKWTYNQAVILKALYDLYIITNDEIYFTNALKIANFVLKKMIDPSNGVLCEILYGAIRTQLSTAAKQFKGIFIRYLTDFAIAGREKMTAEQFKYFSDFVKHNSDFVWSNGKNENLKSFSPYWHKENNEEDAESDIISLVSAFDLFNSSAKFSQET